MPDANLNEYVNLPIQEFKNQIIESVNNNQVTIITAETGAGKSTQVPQFLADAGYAKVIITQPRILAARNLCRRVREEYYAKTGSEPTAKIGYRTAHEKDDAPTNSILYCTDGLQLVRELTGSGTITDQVLILDEIHEWNENMEVLLAWAKLRCKEEPNFKLVLMSATIESNVLAKFFGDYTPIAVPGRSYGVAYGQSYDLYSTIKHEMSDGAPNILVFLPGKAEIEQAISTIKSTGTSVPLIPLHSQLEQDEQQLAFKHYDTGKIVFATNIAQTSITIEDIDTVIDSGLERRIEIKNGVEGLYVAEISRADCLQRAGRAGRTKKGKYILASLNGQKCSAIDKRPEYGIPEIMRKHIDRLALRLTSAELDIEQLEFFHAPSPGAIRLALATLTDLGALKDSQLTEVGKQMERFPVESTYARMLVQAKDLPTETLKKLACIIAIQEVGGIVKGGPRSTGWHALTRQKSSDLLAQYEVFLNIPTLRDYELEPYGIIAKNVEKAEEVTLRLYEALRINKTYDTQGMEIIDPMPVNAEEEREIVKCIISGQLHQLWTADSDGNVFHIKTKQQRELSSSTVVKNAKLFCGTPFDLEINADGEGEVLHLVNDLTSVDLDLLTEIAPNDFSYQLGSLYYDNHLGTVAATVIIDNNGNQIESSKGMKLERSRANQLLFIKLYTRWLYQQLDPNSGVSIRDLEERVSNITKGAVSVRELPKKTRITLERLVLSESWQPSDQPRRKKKHHKTKKHKSRR
jgi:HrpA-like RNA helicase